jgi:predicted RNA-binding protein YlxR (DUF448 family)
MAQVKKKTAGPRPKHVPVRMCIACRRPDAKRGLFRVVRDADGYVTVDPTGKRAGRGAYLCHDPACWEQALKRHGLERALRIESLHPENRATLEQIAQELRAEVEGASAKGAHDPGAG